MLKTWARYGLPWEHRGRQVVEELCLGVPVTVLPTEGLRIADVYSLIVLEVRSSSWGVSRAVLPLELQGRASLASFHPRGSRHPLATTSL